MVSNHFIRWHNQQRSGRAPLARIDRPVRSHFYRGARAQAGIYGTRCTVYDIRYTFYTDCGRGGPEKASTRLSSAARSARSQLGSCTLALHGKWYTRPVCSCHREACAVFYFAALVDCCPSRPLTPRFRVPAEEKEKLLSRQTREDNVAIMPT